mmetsp:Transcript_11225/g.43747  ORF Transcript_11225/g.43747 Transcript_11225/m.43747 type:complete len:286 (+) Transcript_11225:1270-2127(+)
MSTALRSMRSTLPFTEKGCTLAVSSISRPILSASFARISSVSSAHPTSLTIAPSGAATGSRGGAGAAENGLAGAPTPLGDASGGDVGGGGGLGEALAPWAFWAFLPRWGCGTPRVPFPSPPSFSFFSFFSLLPSFFFPSTPSSTPGEEAGSIVTAFTFVAAFFASSSISALRSTIGGGFLTAHPDQAFLSGAMSSFSTELAGDLLGLCGCETCSAGGAFLTAASMGAPFTVSDVMVTVAVDCFSASSLPSTSVCQPSFAGSGVAPVTTDAQPLNGLDAPSEDAAA